MAEPLPPMESPPLLPPDGPQPRTPEMDAVIAHIHSPAFSLENVAARLTDAMANRAPPLPPPPEPWVQTEFGRRITLDTAGLYQWARNIQQEAMRAAVMAERERCAQVCRQLHDDGAFSPADCAAAIRKG